MLTEQQLREMLARRNRTLLPTMLGAVGGVFLYFAVMGLVREPLVALVVRKAGPIAGELTTIALVFSAFSIFLVPSCIAEKYVARFNLMCPACDRMIPIIRCRRLLLTRTCPECGERILEGGRVRHAAVYKRYEAVRTRRMLRTWGWVWPVLGGLALIWHWLDPTGFQNCPQCLWTSPLVGMVSAGWVWLRTHDRRFAPQFAMSAILFCVGARTFWQAL